MITVWIIGAGKRCGRTLSQVVRTLNARKRSLDFILWARGAIEDF